MDVEIPEDLRFTEEHEWIKVEGSKTRIGVTDYAQDRLGYVVFVELPEVGEEVEQVAKGAFGASELGAVESIKVVSEIYAPLSGEIEKVNENLVDEPELVNSDPYGDGWICVIKPSDLERELENLMDSEAYEEFLESEE
ncbi:glycine cleavage system protein H [candidate division MSBL1 archaeon SCGC-AAA259D18]|uniref:Probable glycine cleavage system H protein n=1 Tax=candidate division MSBL1 archaeon SCGC-AAA259D18 TaxID=1698262 RepID=A0A133UCL6_9EURY|nr:glycine cleavage system protein H [candidate division MSBL1 archaeon SCGC-AAA259D18]